MIHHFLTNRISQQPQRVIMDISDSILAPAVADFNAGYFKSINATARADGIARLTL